MYVLLFELWCCWQESVCGKCHIRLTLFFKDRGFFMPVLLVVQQICWTSISSLFQGLRCFVISFLFEYPRMSLLPWTKEANTILPELHVYGRPRKKASYKRKVRIFSKVKHRPLVVLLFSRHSQHHMSNTGLREIVENWSEGVSILNSREGMR